MSSDALERFWASTKIGYMEWHDGVGYDLEALSKLDGVERAQVEEFLVARSTSDWRDIDALAALGGERALRAIESALSAKEYVLRCHAIEHLLACGRLDHAAVVRHLVEMLPTCTILNGMTHVLALAKRYPSDEVKQQLLICASKGKSDVRVHAAALVHHLWGPAKSDFDWGHRDFYLRFGKKEAERRAAFYELCAQIGVDPSLLRENQ